MLRLAVLALALSILIFNPISHAQDATTINQRAQVINAVKKFKDSDIKKSVIAIHTISEMKYGDVQELLIDMANYELTARKNIRIINELLEAIERTADKHSVFPEGALETGNSPLIDLKARIIEVMKNDPQLSSGKLKDLKRFCDRVIQTAKGREYVNSKRLFSYDHLTLLALESNSANTTEILQAATVVPENQQIPQEENQSKELATTTQNEQEQAKRYEKFRDQLTKMSPAAKSGGLTEVKAGDSGPADLLLAGTVRFVTDDIQQDILNDEVFNIIGRDDILENILLVLSRYKEQNAVLLGSKGSGKTSIVDLLAQKIVTGEVADNPVTAFLKDAIVIQTSSARISRLAKTDKPAGQADAMEAYFKALSDIQAKIGRRIVVLIDEMHTLTLQQTEAIKPFIESSKSQILLIGASTSPEYRGAFKQNEAFLSRLQDIPVRELSEAEMLTIFKDSWMKIFKIRHPNVDIDENTMKLILRKSSLVFPDKGTLRASFHFADDIFTFKRYKNPGSEDLTITPEDVYSFIQKKIGIPVDPTDFVAMKNYRDGLLQNILQNVYGQDRMVRDVVDLWMSVLRNESSRGVRVGMVMGKTGTGKTETSLQLALNALGSKEKLFVIKANDYADADDIKLSILFGVPDGVRAGAHSAGTLMDWLDDPSKGKYAGIIVIDEAEKANDLFWIRMMELFDTGTITGGDHKTRTLNRHLILLTSNRGDSEIFPRDITSWSGQQLEDRIKSYGEEELKNIFEKSMDGKKFPDTVTNRIDMYTVSNVILPSSAKMIGQKLVKSMVENYLDRSEIIVNVDDHFIQEFILATNPLQRGARPLTRSLQRYLQSAVEEALGTIPFKRGDSMDVSVVRQNGESQIQVLMNEKKVLVNMPRIKADAPTAMCTDLFAI